MSRRANWAEMRCHARILWAAVNRRPFPPHLPGCRPEHREFWQSRT